MTNHLAHKPSYCSIHDAYKSLRQTTKVGKNVCDEKSILDSQPMRHSEIRNQVLGGKNSLNKESFL